VESVHEPAPEREVPQNFFERLWGVYLSPTSAFREIGHSPRVLVPILVLIAVGLLVGLYLTKNLDLQAMLAAQYGKAVEQGTITKAQMEQQLGMVSKLVGIELIVGAGLGSFVLALIVAGYGKLFSLFAGAENRFKALFSVTLYAMIGISILRSALMVLILHFRGPGDVSLTNINAVIMSNLGSVLSSLMGDDALPKFFMKLAGYIDAFAIWNIALLSIGYSAVSQKLKTSAAATWLGVAYAVLALIGSAVASFFTFLGNS
jgi:hypothetical protein